MSIIEIIYSYFLLTWMFLRSSVTISISLKILRVSILTWISAEVIIIVTDCIEATDLDAALGLHQLQFSLGQVQFQLPQLLLQPVFLLVQRLGGCLVPAGGRRLKGPQGAEQVPTVLTAHYFTLHGHKNTHVLAEIGG